MARRQDKVKEKHRTMLFKAQRGTCARCGGRMPSESLVELPRDAKRLAATIDHVIPRARGGANVLGNKLLMHNECNSAKGDSLPNGCERIFHDMVRLKLAWMVTA